MNVPAQLLANAFILAGQYALVGLTFIVPYLLSRSLNFLVAAPFTLGGYAALLTLGVAGLPTAMIAAAAAGGLMGLISHGAIVVPLRHRDSTALVILIATMGAYVIVQNTLSLMFSDASRQLDAPVLRRVIVLAGSRVTTGQIMGLAVASTALLCCSVLLRTRWGTNLKAAIGNRELAQCTGINVQKLELVATTAAFGLGGLTGVFLAAESNLTPTLGLNALFMGVVVALLAASLSVLRIAGWSLLLSALQTVSGWYIGNEWRHASAFAVLIIVMICNSWRTTYAGRSADK